jgi:hypothetical protein
LGITENPHIVKLNVTLDEPITTNTKTFFQEYKNIFTWNDIDLKGIPPWITQHYIKFNTTIPLARQARYQMNPNYVAIVKQDLDKFLSTSFMALVEEAN